MNKIGLYLQSAFYVFAGVNHFRDPEFYYPLIPEYFTYPELINYLSGSLEVLFGIGLLSISTQKITSYAIIAMLIAFVSSHVYFIQQGSCIEGGLCVPEWIGWGRLLVIHPLLIWWAWKCRKYSILE